MSELLTFQEFLAEIERCMNDAKRRPFGQLLREKVGAKRLEEHPLLQGQNGNGLCLARFLVTGEKIYAGLITSITLHPTAVELCLFGPQLMELNIPYDLLQWFTVEGSLQNGRYAIRDGLLVKEEVQAEGAASENETPPMVSEA